MDRMQSGRYKRRKGIKTENKKNIKEPNGTKYNGIFEAIAKKKKKKRKKGFCFNFIFLFCKHCSCLIQLCNSKLVFVVFQSTIVLLYRSIDNST